MKLSDLIPSKDEFEGLQGVERRLETRRYKSRWSLLLAVVSVVVQIVFLFSKGLSSEQISRLFCWPPASCWQAKDLLIVVPAIAAAVFGAGWVILRYSSFLFRQSRETFRYTFSIDSFTEIQKTPGDRLNVGEKDRMQLLCSDLSERLNTRVGRLSLLKPGDAGKADLEHSPEHGQARSHFHVEGDYAIREDRDGVWMIQVWPRVRIGSANSPYSLAFPVRLPLERAEDQAESESSRVNCKLALLDYERLVERVYSSVATEIYKQIQDDLREKMTLFPTESLRAAARYNEAKDFENSTTIDSYDRALEMYGLSIEAFEASSSHAFKQWLAKWCPGTLWVESFGVRQAVRTEGNTRLGYSRCLIYRRLASDLAGRSPGAIFEIRKELKTARMLLEWCYLSAMPAFGAMPGELRARLTRLDPPRLNNRQRGAAGKTMALRFTSRNHRLAWLAFPKTTLFHPHRKQAFARLREELCEAYTVSALGHSLLVDSKAAEAYLRRAEALGEGDDSKRAMRLLVKAEMEPSLAQRLIYLNEAKDLRPDFELILYRLALYSDYVSRDQGLITEERVDLLVRQYEAVLKVNPGNIASLIGQGYLLWLVKKLEPAAAKFKAGIELQQVVRQTFVGDLRYCLARVEAEQAATLFTKQGVSDEELRTARRLLNQAAADYEEATLADPAVAAGGKPANGSGRKGGSTYYYFITDAIRDRYVNFAATIQAIEKTPAYANRPKSEPGKQLDKPFHTVLSYALNDCGNAYLNYYLRFEVGTPDDESLSNAVDSFERAKKALATNTRVQYNLFVAKTWKPGDEGARQAVDLASQLFDTDLGLSPIEATTVMTFVRATLPDAAEPTAGANAGRQANVEPGNQDVPAQGREAPARRTTGRQEPPARQLGQDAGAASQTGGVEELPANEPTREPGAAEPADAAPPTGYIIHGAPSQQAAARTDEAKEPATPSRQGPAPNTLKDPALKEPAPKEPATLGQVSESWGPPASPQTEAEPGRERNEDRRKKATELIKRGPWQAIQNTRLAPFKAQLDVLRISELLNNKRIEWNRFGDEEVWALVALAQLWSAGIQNPALSKVHQNWTPERLTFACRELCGRILKEYYPEHFETLSVLMQIDESERDHARHYGVICRAYDWAIKYDPTSRLYRQLRLNLCEQRVMFLSRNEAATDYLKLITVYNEAREASREFHAYHASVSRAHEKLEQQLLSSGSRKNAIKHRLLAQREMAQALERDPSNPDYIDALALIHGRHWTFIHGIDAAWKDAKPPDLLEVEVSQSVARDLGLASASDLPPELQQNVRGARERLKTELGFVLPGVRFRDNPVFDTGEYRVVIRSVPLAMNLLDGNLARDEKWKKVTQVLEKAARRAAPELYDSQDAYFALGKEARTGSKEAASVRANAGALALFTRALQSLLSEEVPIVDLRAIVAEFHRCRSLGLGLTAAIEEIRALPAIGRRLPGNSPAVALVRALDTDLEERVSDAIRQKTQGPAWKASLSLRRQLRQLALNFAASGRGKPVTLITGAEVRPFVARLVRQQDCSVNVLSQREALPALLARIQ